VPDLRKSKIKESADEISPALIDWHHQLNYLFIFRVLTNFTQVNLFFNR